MALMTRPSKKLELSKIDEIQSEFFNDEPADTPKTLESLEINQKPKAPRVVAKSTVMKEKPVPAQIKKTMPTQEAKVLKPTVDMKMQNPDNLDTEQGSMSIAALLATAKTQGVRHTSRPYTVPRSLTIDLNRLKSKFRTRSLQYTQNELMDKMVNESMAIVDAENFLEMREKAFSHVKSPEQCSRRSVTLTEETASEMNELKADLALKHNRRFSADEIFMTLLAVAFMPLYKDNLL
jgi:hypothetical protein